MPSIGYSTVKLQSAVACKSTAAGRQSFCDPYSFFMLRNVKIYLQRMLWFFIVLWRLLEPTTYSWYLLAGFLMPLFLSSRPSELGAVAAACLCQTGFPQNPSTRLHNRRGRLGAASLPTPCPTARLSTSPLSLALPPSVSKTYSLLSKKPALEI